MTINLILDTHRYWTCDINHNCLEINQYRYVYNRAQDDIYQLWLWSVSNNWHCQYWSTRTNISATTEHVVNGQRRSTIPRWNKSSDKW